LFHTFFNIFISKNIEIKLKEEKEEEKKANVILSFVVNKDQAKRIFFHVDKELIARFNVIPTGRSPSTTLQPGTF